MNQSKFSFGAVFALMVLLVFSYFTFLGLMYWKNGEIALPIMLTLVFMVVVIGCVFVMCLSKASRFNIGIVGQVIFGFIIFLAFGFSTLPFTNFTKVLENQKQIKASISETLDAANAIDSAYTKYTKVRISDYKRQLQQAIDGKNVNNAKYEQMIGKAKEKISGATDESIMESLTKRLENRLLPEEVIAQQQTYKQQVQATKGMSVWNVMMPQNLKEVKAGVANWADGYNKLSKETNVGEVAEPFVYNEFNSKIDGLTSFYTHFTMPSFLSMIVALLGFAIMLLPYFITDGSIARKKSKKNQNSQFE